MKTFDADDESSPSPAIHSARIRRQLTELIDQLTADVARVNDPTLHALLEVSAEMLKGVRTAYAHYDEAHAKSLSIYE
jgi:hypothetical protein